MRHLTEKQKIQLQEKLTNIINEMSLERCCNLEDFTIAKYLVDQLDTLSQMCIRSQVSPDYFKLD